MSLMLMEVYETDANTLLAIECTPDSLDSRLKRLPADKQDYLKKLQLYTVLADIGLSSWLEQRVQHIK